MLLIKNEQSVAAYLSSWVPGNLGGDMHSMQDNWISGMACGVDCHLCSEMEKKKPFPLGSYVQVPNLWFDSRR